MGRVGLGGFVNLMTQPDPLLNKIQNSTQPTNPLKTDTTRWVGLDRVSFDGFATKPYVGQILSKKVSLFF